MEDGLKPGPRKIREDVFAAARTVLGDAVELTEETPLTEDHILDIGMALMQEWEDDCHPPNGITSLGGLVVGLGGLNAEQAAEPDPEVSSPAAEPTSAVVPAAPESAASEPETEASTPVRADPNVPRSKFLSFSFGNEAFVNMGAFADALPASAWKQVASGVELGRVARNDNTQIGFYRLQSGKADGAQHWHPRGEAYGVIRGGIRDEWSGGGYFGPGTMVWMPEGSDHAPEAVGDTLIWFLWPAGIKPGAPQS